MVTYITYYMNRIIINFVKYYTSPIHSNTINRFRP